MNDIADRQSIADVLRAFSTKPLSDAAHQLFALLGYGSDRRLLYPSLAAFLNEYDKDGRAVATLGEATNSPAGSPILLQQLTTEEIAASSAGQLQLAAVKSADLRQFDSYLFITIPLKDAEPTRTRLAECARAINALFSQPVLVLFHHGERISLAITYRRTHKRDQSRDIIGRKVTLIKDVHCLQPHPGHLAILEDFSLPALSKIRQRDIRNFADLDDAWRESLSAQLLNRQFYREIANWYFWAREHAVFPKDAPVDADGKPSLPLIRLLTRLIFCWFLREKTNPQTGEGLIPFELFDPPRIRELLKDVTPNASTYYTGILQNLFFATLNTEMDEPGRQPRRRFLDVGDGQRSDDHMIHQVWRHASHLRDRMAFERLYRRIPFLNGGLFECLDDRVQKGNSPYTVEVRIDGFSNDPKKQPKLPNFLFFGPDQTVDLSAAYGDSSRSCETVHPLLEIFRRYKFTLTENTPIEEEVALDPELLGHVFENLLGAYNPETGIIARKATGSFYTPRVVVDWMVDEALIAYLESALEAQESTQAAKSERDQGLSGVSSPLADHLRRLVSWDDNGHDFSKPEVEALIDAIDNLKALDPACGSGAFPMGLLQKLVHVLRKVDPENKGWQGRQVSAAQTLSSASVREDALKAIERAFARDNDDYGRKLYLIENCLYGVDIQPIAVQIAKLRFFIALVVDQSIDPKLPNYGILPLPNLETKIVAANTLLGLRRGQLLLGSNEVRALEGELQRVRHDYFTARSYKRKKELRVRDKELRDQLADALRASGECTVYDARRLADWNPYDTNRFAGFFDPVWMFGLPPGREDGTFDIVIGNPPYVRQEELKNVTVTGSDGREKPLKDELKELYNCYTGTADLLIYFYERSLQLLRRGGILSFITSNKYLRAGYGERLRTYLLYSTRPCVMLDFGDTSVFTAISYPCILVTRKIHHVTKGTLPKTLHISQLPPEGWESRVFTWTPGPPLRDFPAIFDEQAFALAQRDLRPEGWRLESPVRLRLLETLRRGGKPLGEYVQGRFYYGLKTGLNEAFVVDRATRNRLIADHPSSMEVLKPYLRGRDVKRWRVEAPDLWLIYVPWHFPLHLDPSIQGASVKAERAFERGYPAIYTHLKGFKTALEMRNKAETGVRYEWYSLQRWGSDYWQEFVRPKIITGRFMNSPTFAYDNEGFFHNNANSFIAGGTPFLTGALNSSVAWWALTQICTDLQNGYLQAHNENLADVPIPDASPEEQRLCGRLAEALIWLNRPGLAEKATGAPLSLMIAYFEQWLNGLVYELFFPGELHDRRLHLFDESAKLAPPEVDRLPEAQKLSRLRDLFERAYDNKAPLRAMLFSLRSLEVVRIIEEPSETSATNQPERRE